MKNIQKILLAILVLVLVAVVILVIIVKSDKNDNASVESSPTYSIPADEEFNTDTGSQNHNSIIHNQSQNNTVSDQDTKPGSDKNNNFSSSDQSSSDSQHTKSYNLSDAKVIQEQKSSFGKIRLLSAKSDGMNVYLLEANVENKKFYYEFPGSYIIENIYYANVDGRYGDEVIVHSNTGSNDIYNNVILKITKNGIESLLSKNQATELMSGFTSTLKKNFTVEIFNKFTNKNESVYVKDINNENYIGSYWDKNGNITDGEIEDNVWFEKSYYIFEPRDVDEDGIYEIFCLQNASLGSSDSLIGRAQTTLKFNTESKEFEITDSDFYPKNK